MCLGIVVDCLQPNDRTYRRRIRIEGKRLAITSPPLIYFKQYFLMCGEAPQIHEYRIYVSRRNSLDKEEGFKKRLLRRLENDDFKCR